MHGIGVTVGVGWDVYVWLGSVPSDFSLSGRSWASFKDGIGLFLPGLIVGSVVVTAVLPVPVLSVVLDEIVVVIVVVVVVGNSEVGMGASHLCQKN